MSETAGMVQDIQGDKLYQERARLALPILVRQSASRSQIFYADLADELSMPNPRNLNWVLGCVGITLEGLSAKKNWRGRPIPPIQSLVINQAKGLPGAGFDGFLRQRTKEYKKLTSAQKRDYLSSYWSDVFAYPYWMEVLSELGLIPDTGSNERLIQDAKVGRSGGGGEGPEHRALKIFIQNNPTSVGLLDGPIGDTESPLPSGDKVDVLFHRPGRLVAIEVKSEISNDVDITRGLFQCVKYRAVMEAERGANLSTHAVEVVLVLGRSFPNKLAGLRNSLGVKVIEIIS